MLRNNAKRNMQLMNMYSRSVAKNETVITSEQLASIFESMQEHVRLRKLERHLFMWMLRFTQGYISLGSLKTTIGDKLDYDDVVSLYNCALYKPRHYRKRALTIVFHFYGISKRVIAEFLNIAPRTVAKYIQRFSQLGTDEFLDWSKKITKKVDDKRYEEAVFTILHAPPSTYGINRTSWRIEDIRKVMVEQGMLIGHNNIGKIIHNAGYRFRKSKTVLTSTDPNYREKLAEIKKILSKLKNNEKFFSIDEFGPFAVKMKGGRSFVPRGQPKIVPQWQRSKGCLILTAALELSTNQVTHFYSKKKNTGEMIELLKHLLKKYKSEKYIYLSWDRASWHASKKFYSFVEEVNHTEYRISHGTPIVRLAPLPAGAQFLNVIESVFSGMARAVIHNIDYESVKACKLAINQHFAERNHYFKKNPKRAGKKIWGDELVPATFSEANNCKPQRWMH